MRRRSFPALSLVLGILFLAQLASAQDGGRRTGHRTKKSKPPSPAASAAANASLRFVPDILLILADDLGVESLSDYQGDLGINPADVPPFDTPNLETLAANGVRFLNAWSTPLCSPTRAGIYSGYHPFNTQITKPSDVEITDETECCATPCGYTVGTCGSEASLECSLQNLVPGAPALSLPQVLPSTYRSGLFGKWHVGAQCDGNIYDAPLSLGWDSHKGTFGVIPEVDTYCDWTKVEDGVASSETTYASDYVVDKATEWIQATAAGGYHWFATVAFNTPHTPLHDASLCEDCSAGTCVNCETAADYHTCFASMVNSMDTHIGELLSNLKEAGLLSRAIVIFAADNGTDNCSAQMNTELASCDESSCDETDPTPYAACHWKSSVYQGGVHVPLIVADGCQLSRQLGPSTTRRRGLLNACMARLGMKIVSPGRTSSALVHTTDLFATISEIAGGVVTSTSDSVSFRPVLVSAGAPSPHSYLLTDVSDNDANSACAIRDSRYKLIVSPCESGSTGCEFYDLETDPFEKHDKIADSLSLSESSHLLLLKLELFFKRSILPSCP